MRLTKAVDDFFLSFFTKISHNVYWLTGRTNFFLAKLALCVMVASVMVVIFNYWFPAMLGYRSAPFQVAACGLISMFCLADMVRCDKAEKSAFNDERVRMFNPLYYSPSNRVLWIFIANIMLFLAAFLFIINQWKGYFIFNALDFAFSPAIVAFKYFISVDPPSPGKSKIREWIESLSAGFWKPALARAKS
ncbi:MAG: hypothetical protein Q7J30_01995 [Candidatus Azambacteria bacterium]|nr:hypothetical protein [Candidatus Azambacteria bacterium]